MFYTSPPAPIELAEIFDVTWFVEASYVHLLMVLSLCVCVQIFPFENDSSCIGLEPSLITSFEFDYL